MQTLGRLGVPMKSYACSFVLATLVVIQACKPAAGSKLSDAATTSSVKSGIFTPKDVYLNKPSRNSAPMPVAELVKRMGVYVAQDGFKYLKSTVAPDGEQILIIDRKDGSHPVPTYSLAADGTYRWDSMIQFQGDKYRNSRFFIRYKKDTKPTSFGPEDMYVVRDAVSTTGVPETFIVPWLRHIRSETDANLELFRIGNSILAADSGKPVMKYETVSTNVWRLSGAYDDGEVSDGSIFWTADGKTFHSVNPKKKKATTWKVQDADSLDRVATASLELSADVKSGEVDGKAIPSAALSAIRREINRKAPPFVQLGFDLTVYDDSVIRVDYVKPLAAGLGLTGAEEGPQYVDFEPTGLGLANPQFPSQYSSAKPIGTHSRVVTQSSGWWPWSSTSDKTVQTPYYFVERPDPNAGGAMTRKVIFQDETGAWKEDSATRFRAELETMQRNSTADKQAALEARGRAEAKVASDHIKALDKDSTAFTDKGFVGHMTDVGVGAAKGAAGPLISKQIGLGNTVGTAAEKLFIEKSGTMILNGTASVAGETVKTVVSGQQPGPDAVANAGVGVVGDTLNSVLPGSGGVISGVSGAAGANSTEGTVANVVNGTGDVAATLSTLAVTDPVTGAAIGAGVEGGKKVIEGSTYIVGYANATNQASTANETFNGAIQARNDRQFTQEAIGAFDSAWDNSTGAPASPGIDSTQGVPTTTPEPIQAQTAPDPTPTGDGSTVIE